MANISDIFLPEKWLKTCACLWKCFLWLRKPFSEFVTIVTLRPLSVNMNTVCTSFRVRLTNIYTKSGTNNCYSIGITPVNTNWINKQLVANIFWLSFVLVS